MKKEWLYAFAFLGLALIYISGLCIDLMDIDAAQYGSISMEMFQSGHYLQIKDHGLDYLDKPPLLFWLSALCFKLFGIASWSYKLPSFLFSLLGFYSTYRFAKLYYNELTARLSALMLASCQALVLINNDVRTDTLLTSSVIFGVWQLAEYLENNRAINIVGAGVGISFALLAKGPIGLMVPVLGFSTDWIVKREWRNFLKPAWLLVAVIVAFMLAPMLYGLYEQFGLHGWYFYFWQQSFGRLTGQNPFVNQQIEPQGSAPLFFVHTFLWSFLPWSLFFVYGFVRDWVKLIKNGFWIPRNNEVITLYGFTLGLIGLSMSAYKLPHYIYVVFPFAAVIAAKAMVSIIEMPRNNVIYKTQMITGYIIGGIAVIASWTICLWVFPLEKGWLYILPAIFSLLFLLSVMRKEPLERLLMPALMGFIAFNIVMNLQGFPSIMRYETSAMVGHKVVLDQIPTGQFFCYRTHDHSLDFYSKHYVPELHGPIDIRQAANDHAWIYTDKAGLNEIHAMGLQPATVDSFPYYRVAVLSLPFLDPRQRNEHTDTRFLIKL